MSVLSATTGACTRPPLEWAAVGKAAPGQLRSGDVFIVEQYEEGVLVGVIDALGHGDGAADVAELCARIMREQHADPLDELVRACHRRLVGSRGVVMSIARFEAAEPVMTWTGVGNVDATLVRAPSIAAAPGPAVKREGMLALGGVVGGTSLPRLRASRLPIAPGDVVVLCSDGVRTGYYEAIDTLADAASIANNVVDRHGRDNDDVMVLALRVGGGA